MSRCAVVARLAWGITKSTGNNLLVSFAAQAQLSYAVQTNAILSPGGWQIWQLLSPVATNRIITLTNPAPGAMLFYRVRTPAN